MTGSLAVADGRSSAATAPVLEARDLSFGYSPSTPVLQDWSASFAGGSMTALTGLSGRGKSTALYLLGLMLRPRAGIILLDGRSASDGSDAERARLRAEHFGFVFQDAALDTTRTVLDNVTETALYRHTPRQDARARGLALMRQFEVDVPPGRRPGQVSGGQAQRIALCRALLFTPRVLLADEPTGNLDPTTSQLVVSALREHAQTGAAVIVVTHSRDVADACDGEIRL